MIQGFSPGIIKEFGNLGDVVPYPQILIFRGGINTFGTAFFPASGLKSVEQLVGFAGNGPLFTRNTLLLFVIAIPTCREKQSIREFAKMLTTREMMQHARASTSFGS